MSVNIHSMAVQPSCSNAPSQSVALISAIVDFVLFRSDQHSRAGLTDSFIRSALRNEVFSICRKIWANCDLYVGNTHFRILLDGVGPGREGVYVDCEGILQ